jgi:hypothetical protein
MTAAGQTAFERIEALLLASLESDRAANGCRRVFSAPGPEQMARIDANLRQHRREAAAQRRESLPAAEWAAKLCPMVGQACITTQCVCWTGTTERGFCAQVAAMRRQVIEERSAPCS